MSWEHSFAEELKAISPSSIVLLKPPIQDANLCGVVIESKPIRQSNFGKKDYNAILGIKDPTGYVRMNLFHAIESELPQVEKPGLGDVILIKHLKINIFNSTRQAVSTPRTIHVMVRRGEKADSFKQHWISDNDRRVIGLMQRWWDAKESKEGSIRVIPGYGRPLIEVHALTDSIKYFDIVLQVITKAEQHHANRMNAYLTDYTVNPQPPMRFLETGMAGVVDTHLVIQGWFWDNQMSLISQVQSGEVIKVRNAVRILSPSNELEFNVHGSSDAKPNIQRLPIDGAEARSLLRRKDAYEQHKQSLGSQSSQMPQKTSYPPIQQQQQEPYYHQQQQQQQGIVPQQQGIVPQQQGIVPQQQFNQQFNQPTGMSTNPMMSPSNWQAGPAPDLVNDMMDTDNIATEVTDLYIYKSIEEVFKAEVGTRCFTKASIIDTKPRQYEHWISKSCPTCHETATMDLSSCPKCKTPTELERTLKFALKIQDTSNHKMILSCFGQEAAKLFPGIDLSNVDSVVESIKEFIEQACPIIPEKQLFLDFGVESYDVNGGRCYQVVNTKFVKLA